MLQQYVFELTDKTGRVEHSVATGNTVAVAGHVALLNATLARGRGGLGMMAPVEVKLSGLAA